MIRCSSEAMAQVCPYRPRAAAQSPAAPAPDQPTTAAVLTGLGVLTVTPTGIARITVFGGGPDLAAKFGFPPVRRRHLVDRGAERTRVLGAETLLQVRDGIMEEMPESDVVTRNRRVRGDRRQFHRGARRPRSRRRVTGAGPTGWPTPCPRSGPGSGTPTWPSGASCYARSSPSSCRGPSSWHPTWSAWPRAGTTSCSGADVDALAAEFEPAVAKLQAAGCRVLIFTGFDPRMFPVIRLLRGRIAAYNMHLRGIADDYGCDLVDLWSMRALKDTRAWSPDRLHLTTEGHRRVALRACEVLGVPVAEDWRAPLPGVLPPSRSHPPCAPPARRTGPSGWPRAARTPAGPADTRPRGCAGGSAARPAATACRPSAPTCSRSQ